MINLKETVDLYSFEILLSSGNKINYDHLLPLFESLFNEDKLKISITIDGTDPIPFLIDNKEDIKKVLDQNENIEEDSETLIKLEVIKNCNKSIQIYNINSFIKYLEELNLNQILSIFSNYNKFNNKIPIFFNQNNYQFSTNLFSTADGNKEIDNFVKNERIESLNLVSNTSGASNFNFIPEDFRVFECSDELINLKLIFDKIATFLSITFISDWSELNKNNLHFKILGYKKIDFIIPFVNKIENSEIFFKIYKWIYESGNGNIEDKLGLARNIISRFIKNNDQGLVLDEEAYSSIITSYKIYLKENVEKYIETKNKVAELTTELSIKISNMNHFIVNNFKNNNFTIIGYFITLFIFNSFSFKQTVVFNKHTFAISLIVLFISRLYLHLTSIQLRKDISFNKSYFLNVKSIYKDLFDETELDNLFNLNFFEESSTDVKNTFKTYKCIWLIEIYLILLVSILITFTSEIKSAINFFINLF